ncbi:MAG: DmsC/YnfH family molybdoenzyme membrane anchor subunit [Nitrospira sp.]
MKPACVTACLGNALEFGVIEDIPAGRHEAKLEIPGFPDPEISRPNIRFQQNRALPDNFRHVDADPIRYERDINENNQFSVKPLSKKRKTDWGLDQLRSREDPLVFFTLATQFAVGGFLLIFLAPFFSNAMGCILTKEEHPVAMAMALFGLVALQTTALVSSTLHLGKPKYFYRAMYNLRHSWVSREIAAVGAFYNFFFAYALVRNFPLLISWLPEAYPGILTQVLGGGAAFTGPLGLYCMYRCYRIKARPFWDHWHSGGAFFSSTLILGGLGIGLIFGFAEFMRGHSPAFILSKMAFPLLAGMLLQGGALLSHLQDMKVRGEEAAVSHELMLGKYGKTYSARWVSWTLLLMIAVLYAALSPEGGWALLVWGGVFFLALAHEVIGRALFYGIVVPTTSPGGIFWKNQSFQTQALQSGLADLPQVGVVQDHG